MKTVQISVPWLSWAGFSYLGGMLFTYIFVHIIYTLCRKISHVSKGNLRCGGRLGKGFSWSVLRVANSLKKMKQSELWCA